MDVATSSSFKLAFSAPWTPPKSIYSFRRKPDAYHQFAVDENPEVVISQKVKCLASLVRESTSELHCVMEVLQNSVRIRSHIRKTTAGERKEGLIEEAVNSFIRVQSV